MNAKYYVEPHNNNSGYYFKSENTIYKTQTDFQQLEILDIPNYGKTLRLDNIFQTSEKDEFLYHEPLVHVAGITMNGPKVALVLGGGDGGAIKEFLKYNTIKKMVMVEIDSQVTHISRKYLPKLSDGAFDSSKLNLIFDDGKKYIENTNEIFDQILLDLTDPFGVSVDLYTADFYQNIKRILSPNKGAVSLHIQSPITRPDLHNRIYWTLKSVFKHVHVMLNFVPLYSTLWGYAIATDSLQPQEISSQEIDKRIKMLGLKNLKYYNGQTHHGLLALPNYEIELLKNSVSPIQTGEILIDDDAINNTFTLIKDPKSTER